MLVNTCARFVMSCACAHGPACADARARVCLFVLYARIFLRAYMTRVCRHYVRARTGQAAWDVCAVCRVTSISSRAARGSRCACGVHVECMWSACGVRVVLVVRVSQALHGPERECRPWCVRKRPGDRRLARMRL